MYPDQQFSTKKQKRKENTTNQSAIDDATDTRTDYYQQEKNGFASTVSRRFRKHKRASVRDDEQTEPGPIDSPLQ